MVINRSNIPLPEEVYNPQAGAAAFGEAFKTSLFNELNAAKLKKIKMQENAYGLLKEMAGSKYYEATEPIDWNSAIANPALEMGKFRRIAPADEQLIDQPVYQQSSAGGVEQVNDPTTGLPMTYKGKPGTKPEILPRVPETADVSNLVDIPVMKEQEGGKLVPVYFNGKPFTYKGKPGSQPKILPKGVSDTSGVNWANSSEQQKMQAKNVALGHASTKGMGTRDRTIVDLLATEYANMNDIPYDQYLSDVRGQIYRDFNVGAAGKNIRSINTAIGHVADFKKEMDILSNTRFKFVNKGVNFLKEQVGDPDVVTAATNVEPVVNEMITAFKGIGATIPDIESWKKIISVNMAPAQSTAFVNKLITLLESRLTALNQQWNQAYQGTPESFKTLNEKSTKLLTDMGFQDLVDQYQNFGDKDRTSSPNSPQAPPEVAEPQPTLEFSNVEDAEAANLPPGTEVLINGRRAVID